MAKVTFIFTGVGVIYQKEATWKIIFPFDDCHKVKFEQPTMPTIPLNTAGAEISVVINNGKTQSTSLGAGHDKIFDLTQFNPNLTPRKDWRKDGVLLTISSENDTENKVVVSMQDETHSRYQLLKPGSNPIDLNKIAFSVKAEIELNEGGSVTINASHPGFPKTFTGSSGDDTLTFNNNCDGNPASDKGDLQMLYDLIFDVPATEQFNIDRHPDDKPTMGETMGSAEPMKMFEQLGQKVATISDLIKQLNLSPLNHNVKPKELGGLPCYLVKAGNPTNLP